MISMHTSKHTVLALVICPYYCILVAQQESLRLTDLRRSYYHGSLSEQKVDLKFQTNFMKYNQKSMDFSFIGKSNSVSKFRKLENLNINRDLPEELRKINFKTSSKKLKEVDPSDTLQLRLKIHAIQARAFDSPKNALLEMKRIAEEKPSSVYPLIGLAKLKLIQNKTQEACEFIRQSLKKKIDCILCLRMNSRHCTN